MSDGSFAHVILRQAPMWSAHPDGLQTVGASFAARSRRAFVFAGEDEKPLVHEWLGAQGDACRCGGPGS